MKWFTREQHPLAAEVPVIELTTEKPTTNPIPEKAAVDIDEEMDAEYLAVATEIGIADHGATLEERLCRFLRDNSIDTYNGAKVAKYLQQELGNWEWRGLRECDREHFAGSWFAHHGDARIPFSDSQIYSEAIPLPVLLTVKKISAEFPMVHFYVSHSSQTGDPFLMVAMKSMSNFIVERWDEPGFRE